MNRSNEHPGFERVPEGRGFMSSLGILYMHRKRPILALRITQQHLNGLGHPHGGMLATLADSALGMLMAREAGLPGVTVSLSIDYLSPGRLGDWVEAHVQFDKLGQRLRFGGCRLLVGERCLLKANAVFAVPRPHST
ncbi:putative enzyme (plasmid) [Cupriavidus taiwanensis]|uniref:Enzyme n=1 Tax=Cupriavidus taiwanensis TaxID=164546 RepID=A0A9Q7UX32_9BURK|nr:PaaI family thioesterase [Cupriavidus taiwanensis]SPD67579.1 putative enzyme [Cupriavidus taiwanensis]